MKSRSVIAAAADLKSLRTHWAGFRPDVVFCFCAPDIDLGRHAAACVAAAFPGAKDPSKNNLNTLSGFPTFRV